MHPIEIRDLTKYYGRNCALNNISLDLHEGRILGLLGPNGAGKTTLVKCILDLSRPQSGTIMINSQPAGQPSSRQTLAFMPERFSFFPYYTVEGCMLFYAKMFRLGQPQQAVTEAIEKLRIGKIRRQRIKTLSKGQLQRLGLACTILSGARIVILDEPFSGLDPLGIREVKQLIRDLHQRGCTILINSHILAEVEQICDDIAILHEGEIIARGELQELKGQSSLEDLFCSLVEHGNA